MELDNVVPKCSDHLGSGEGVAQVNEVGKLRQAINPHHKCVVALGLRQSLDEVHREVMPLDGWHGQWLELAGWARMPVHC